MKTSYVIALLSVLLLTAVSETMFAQERGAGSVIPDIPASSGPRRDHQLNADRPGNMPTATEQPDTVLIPQAGGALNVAYQADKDYYWFAYEARSNTFLKLLYCGEKSDVSLYATFEPSNDDAPGFYGFDYCIPAEYKGRVIKLQVPKGEKIYIRVRTNESISLEAVALPLPDHLSGATCEDPVALTEGENYLPVHGIGIDKICWQSYTAPYDCELTINTGGGWQSFRRYTSCSDPNPKALYPENGIIKFSAEAGEKILLSCSNMDPLSISFTVKKFSSYPQLTDGEVAVPYKEGTKEYFFEYSAGQNTYMKVLYCGAGKAELMYYTNPESEAPIYAGSDHCDKAAGTGTGVRLQIPRGTTAYVKLVYKELPPAGENPTLTVSTVSGVTIAGGDCNNPIALKTGNVFFPYNPKNTGCETWFTYTAAKDEMLTFASEEALTLYRYDDCTAPKYTEYYTSDDQNRLSVSLRQGETLLLSSDHNRPMMVALSLFDYELGRNCTAPIELKAGNNELTVEGKRDYWLSYTPAQDSYLQVRNCSADIGATIALFKTCSARPIPAGVCPETGAGVYLRIPVKRAQTYKICLSPGTAAVRKVTLEVSEQTAMPGEDCTNPVPATEGSNKFTEQYEKNWYSYTARTSGRLVITASAGADFNGNLQLNTDCTAWKASAVSDPDTHEISLETPVEAGTQYLFFWQNYTGEKASFTFSLAEYDLEKGASWQDPVPVQEGTNPVPKPWDTKPASSWYIFKSSRTGWLNTTVKHPLWDTNETGRVVCYKKTGDRKPTKVIRPNLIDILPENGGCKHSVMVEKDSLYYLELSTLEAMPGLALIIDQSDFIPGDFCATALEQSGEIIKVVRRVGREWYRYIAPKDGFYTVKSNTMSTWSSTFTNSNIELRSGDCDAAPAISVFNKESGEYAVETSAKKGDAIFIGIFNAKYCPGTVAEIAYTQTSGTDKAPAAEALRLYPTPTDGILHLDLCGLPSGTYRLSVSDLSGRMIRRESRAIGLHTTIDCSGLPAGTYILQIEDPAGQTSIRRFDVKRR